MEPGKSAMTRKGIEKNVWMLVNSWKSKWPWNGWRKTKQIWKAKRKCKVKDNAEFYNAVFFPNQWTKVPEKKKKESNSERTWDRINQCVPAVANSLTEYLRNAS